MRLTSHRFPRGHMDVSVFSAACRVLPAPKGSHTRVLSDVNGPRWRRLSCRHLPGTQGALCIHPVRQLHFDWHRRKRPPLIGPSGAPSLGPAMALTFEPAGAVQIGTPANFSPPQKGLRPSEIV